MRRFYIFKRSSFGIYHVQFKAPDASYLLPPRSLRTRDPNEAFPLVIEWLQNGIPSPFGERQSIGEAATVEAAFRSVRTAPLSSADALRIIRERLAHGQRATKRHCQDMEGRAKEIEALLPAGLTLGETRRSHLAASGDPRARRGEGAGLAALEAKNP
jgi:hypothetical protein